MSRSSGDRVNLTLRNLGELDDPGLNLVVPEGMGLMTFVSVTTSNALQ